MRVLARVMPGTICYIMGYIFVRGAWGTKGLELTISDGSIGSNDSSFRHINIVIT